MTVTLKGATPTLKARRSEARRRASADMARPVRAACTLRCGPLSSSRRFVPGRSCRRMRSAGNSASAAHWCAKRSAVSLTKPFGHGVNFEIHVSNVDQLHSAVTGGGKECFLPIENRWYRRDDRQLGVRQFAVQDPDGYLIRLSQSIGDRSIPC